MADSTVKKTLRVKKAQDRPSPDTAQDDSDGNATDGASDDQAATMVPVRVAAPAKKPPYTYAAILALIATIAVIALLVLQVIEWDTYDPMFPRAVPTSPMGTAR